MRGIKNQVVIMTLSPLTPTLSRWRPAGGPLEARW